VVIGTTKCVVEVVGRNLVRPSDSLFFAPQSDSEKKKNAIRKSSARNDQIRGLFGSPQADFFFSDTRESRAKPELLGLEREQSQAGAKAED
jgi:hypothetical protein